MKVGMIGVGEMGYYMAGHLVDKGHDTVAYDVNAERLAAAAKRGAKAVSGLAEMAGQAEVFIVIVRTDEQVQAVVDELVKVARPGSLIAAAGTHSLEFMKALAAQARQAKLRFIDAPVVYGTRGAIEGNLLSLCGGEKEDVEFGTPAMLAYSQGVEHVGPIGAGQLAKTCNNLLHWVHCVANFETIALAKQYGIDGQRMREVLQKCPGDNGTLRRWDTTKFTWQEKDMDFVMELAQDAGLMMPLTSVVDQLVKKLTAADVKALLYEPETRYLGQKVASMPLDKGGLKG